MTISLNKTALVQAMLLLFSSFPAVAASLLVDTGKPASPATLTTETLLAMPDVATVQVPADAELQITATDGFVTNLPAALVRDEKGHGATPWLAIEPHDTPWPRTAKGTDIGPFYLVW